MDKNSVKMFTGTQCNANSRARIITIKLVCVTSGRVVCLAATLLTHSRVCVLFTHVPCFMSHSVPSWQQCKWSEQHSAYTPPHTLRILYRVYYINNNKIMQVCCVCLFLAHTHALTLGSGQHPYPPPAVWQQVFPSSHIPPSGQMNALHTLSIHTKTHTLACICERDRDQV